MKGFHLICDKVLGSTPDFYVSHGTVSHPQGTASDLIVPNINCFQTQK